MLRLRVFLYQLGEYFLNLMLLAVLSWCVYNALAIKVGWSRADYVAVLISLMALGLAGYASALLLNYVRYANAEVEIQKVAKVLKGIAEKK